MSSTSQVIAEQTVRYCNAMQAYDLREAVLNLLPRESLKNNLIGKDNEDQEFIAGIEAMDKDTMIEAILDFEMGGAVKEAEELLEAYGVDVPKLEGVRRFGASYPMVASYRFDSFIVTPDNKPPIEELSKIFENGYATRMDPEESEEKGNKFTEWHLQPLAVIDLIKVINYYKMKFVKLDNSEYVDRDRSSLGDLVYQNSAGVILTIFNLSPWGPKFIEWAPQLKSILDKA